MPLTTDPARVDQGTPRHRNAVKVNEKPLGEWNQYEITVNGDRVTLKVNGETLNEGTGAEVVPGYIALQSEGGAIQFRDIRLTPLPEPRKPR
jgi:hypothetical protein